ncbi:hypothetical protein BCY91_16675 [Pelobium manganitolerans]|uniref:Uncharacterized protein n=1 Tax=Pelobium manganitolerans TaxID=1842495 RepID=A0A419S833_9SPHI|nr:hypothetical protein [Pelobium manganitolerans]RKD17634.1 hypothetical protein BCY91_16675 [Pelobium manganitolerans]
MKTITSFIVAGLIGYSMTAFGQTGKEHLEHPINSKKSELTIKSLSKGVKEYVQTEQKSKGHFIVHDSVTHKDLQLTLKKIHDDRLASLGDNVYFVCADFQGSDNNVYDVDIFMKWDGKVLSATDRKVHKVNGKERYTWYNEGNIWKTKPAGKKSDEHPKSEHPKSN